MLLRMHCTKAYANNSCNNDQCGYVATIALMPRGRWIGKHFIVVQRISMSKLCILVIKQTHLCYTNISLLLDLVPHKAH